MKKCSFLCPAEDPFSPEEVPEGSHVTARLRVSSVTPPDPTSSPPFLRVNCSSTIAKQPFSLFFYGKDIALAKRVRRSPAFLPCFLSFFHA